MQEDKFIHYIDDLRETKNITREELVTNIMSTRQYARLLKGETSIKMCNVVKLAEKLDLSLSTLFYYFSKSESDEYNKMNEISNFISRFQYSEAETLFNEINENNLKSENHVKYYSLIRIKLNYYLKRVGKKQTVSNLMKLFDYPKILSYTSLNYLEINGLITISSITNDSNIFKTISYHIYNILNDDRFLGVKYDKRVAIVLYENCARSLAKLNEYEKSLKMSNKGIELCMENRSFHSLNSLLFFKALSEKKLNHNYEKSIYKLYSLITLEDTDEVRKLFNTNVEQSFGISVKGIKIIKNFNQKEDQI